MHPPETPEGPEPPDVDDLDDVGKVDELAERRAQRFARGGDTSPLRYACPTCGAHALFRGPCLVCLSDVTQRIDADGRPLPPE